MDRKAVLETFMEERRNQERDDERLEALPLVTRRSFPQGQGHSVSAFALDGGNAEEAIQEQIEHFSKLGEGFEWTVYGTDFPTDLVDRLRRSGFSIGAREAVVVYDLADGLEPFETDGACRVERIERVEQIADFRCVAEEVFRKPYDRTSDALAKSIQDRSTDHVGYIGYLDDLPVSIGRLYTFRRSRFGGLYGGGTIESFRGRGCYRSVFGARARDAAKLGARYLQVDALPTSLPILLRLGFQHLTDTWPCEWAP